MPRPTTIENGGRLVSPFLSERKFKHSGLQKQTSQIRKARLRLSRLQVEADFFSLCFGGWFLAHVYRTLRPANATLGYYQKLESETVLGFQLQISRHKIFGETQKINWNRGRLKINITTWLDENLNYFFYTKIKWVSHPTTRKLIISVSVIFSSLFCPRMASFCSQVKITSFNF